MRNIKLLIATLLFCTFVRAQQNTVSGLVLDESNMPIPGANIIAKGTATGTQTDFDGKFSVTLLDGNEIIKVSYIGYVTQEINIKGKNEIIIILKEDVSQLEEVVVVGYGTQSKKDITGSVSVVSGDDIASRSTSNVSNALQGAVAGVSVTRSSTEPGAGNTIKIRGITTLQGDSSPLILVDDIPVASINDVNAAEIESISILKDGAAAAIYGSRAAAGVVIITTKKAKTGSFKIDYTAEYGINKPTEIRKSVQAVRYMEMFNESIWNDNNNLVNEFSTYDPEIIANYASLNAQDPDNYPDTNWRELILKEQSETTRHNLSLSGGTEKLKTSANFGYEYQNALYANRDWKRYTGRINNELQLSDKIGAVLNIAFKQTDEEKPLTDPTNYAINYGTVYPALWEDGRLADGKTGDNPYATLLYAGTQETNNTLVYGKFGLFFKPIEDLKISVNIAPNYEFTKYKSFHNSIPYWGSDDPDKLQTPSYIFGSAPSDRDLIESRTTEKTITTQALVEYSKLFGNHSIESVFGVEEYYKETEALKVRGNEFISNDYPYLSQAPVDKVFDNGSSISEVAYSSLFGRVSYDFNKKYFLQGTLRRDGSSRFGKDYRWGTFPSLAASWVISEEDFMKNVAPIDFLKLRTSYGTLGNDRLGNYLYASVLQFSDVLIANGNSVESVRSAAQTFFAVEDITWETTVSKNIAIDANMFDDRLSLTAEYFQKETSDMLLSLNIPSLSGFIDPTVNVGDMKTTGWEASIGWNDVIGDLKFSASANIFDSKSILGYVSDKRLFSSNKLSEEGLEFQSWYGYESDGIYQTQEEVDNSAVTSGVVSPGDIKYVDQLTVDTDNDGIPDKGDGVINTDDQVVLGGSLPRYQYGANISLGYKGFDLGMTFQGVGKQKFYLNPNTYVKAFDAGNSPREIVDGNYWSVYNTIEENAAVDYPRLGFNNQSNNLRFSDYWLKNGAYLRLKNITLGYTLPSDVINKIGISKLRVYVSGNDLFSFDHLPNGIDPEQVGSYLVTKTFLLGLKVNL
ncbi:TonB-dependent receptor [Lutibacter sp. A80]|uniref:SusC/RagA family TonB-linked outer membrane protein n=1 Tax=Lutibacter sp. A80 TaxID=2918453 RepID=UPI001F06ACC0|nr:TonB-dependent receptor [Lutibacter sp. A80]UMB62103.1 TonB-dependent receptor [Lutibacter sp. A80]